MNLIIRIPFSGTDKLVSSWAHQEEEIDFRTQTELAARCTISFTATELKSYLSQTLDANIQIASHESYCDIADAFNIYLHVEDFSSKNESFLLEPVANGIKISGSGRTGVLYGAYELLRMQGWRWFAPGPAGEICPKKKDSLVLPEKKQNHGPSFELGRGFIFEYKSQDSADLWLWMARNRLNISGCRPYTANLCEKLGMSAAVGGHILTDMLHQERILPSGETVWNEHPEWYGLPENGERTKETALKTQFCVCCDDMIAYVGDELLKLLNGKWYYADRVDIWGFDTWGKSCTCENCVKIGNPSDQILHFISALREILNVALVDGRLNHPIRMSICAYEGTATIGAPVNPIPQNLLDAGDFITFFPINRCYAHDFDDNSCLWNKLYADNLRAWLKSAPKNFIMVCEYYNVSKFVDLPLIFTERMSHDMSNYLSAGVAGITYMHLPFINWGMRTLNQLLHAQLSWNIKTDVNALLDEYFCLWYGSYAKEMRKAYELIEEAMAYCSQWRAWSSTSMLTQLISWSGNTSEKTVVGNDHFTTREAVESARESVKLLKNALEITNKSLTCERDRLSLEDNNNLIPCSPREMRLLELKHGAYEKRLAEDRRLLYYGVDMMQLMEAVTAFYVAACDDNLQEAEEQWFTIEVVADKMDGYYMPVSFSLPGPSIIVYDALSRAQLRDCTRRCRKTLELMRNT